MNNRDPLAYDLVSRSPLEERLEALAGLLICSLLAGAPYWLGAILEAL